VPGAAKFKTEASGGTEGGKIESAGKRVMDENLICSSGEQRKARIFVVEDHPVFREGLAHIIQLEPDLELCGETDNGGDALAAIVRLKPDLVTVDIRLRHNGDGLDLLRNLNEQFPNLPALVISLCEESLFAERALKAGARGYVMKEHSGDKLISAIRTLLKGGIYVSPQIATLALDRMIGRRPAKSDEAISRLSNRELQLLQLLGTGMPNRKIAERLHLSVKTVEAHRENIKHKLGILSGDELIQFATDWVNGQTSEFYPAKATGNIF
jgi:DNA-binding NarL/FixJ family response regulator